MSTPKLGDNTDVREIMGLINELAPRTHAGTATILAARLERPLEWLIQVNMPNLSNRMKGRMFSGYGALASFSAKIDIALALGFIDADLSRKLHAIRDIRNEFAHADEEIHFHHPRVLALIAKLPDQAKKDPVTAFTDTARQCSTALGDRLHRAMLAKELLARHTGTPPASPDKAG